MKMSNNIKKGDLVKLIDDSKTSIGVGIFLKYERRSHRKRAHKNDINKSIRITVIYWPKLKGVTYALDETLIIQY